MTLSRRHKTAIALLSLLAFLSQGAFAALGGHVHAGDAAQTAAVIADAVPPAYDPVHHHHGADAGHDGAVVHASAAACEEPSACLCCIGSCASLLLNALADTVAIPVVRLRFAIEPFLSATPATSLYRPPILA